MLLMGRAHMFPNSLSHLLQPTTMKFHTLTLDLHLISVERYIKLLWTSLNLILFDFNNLAYQSFPDLLSNLLYHLRHVFYLLASCQLQT